MRVQPSHLGLLALCALLPFATDAGAGQAKCCNIAASYQADVFPGGGSDEDFFAVPGGPPSLMILFDNSGSMMDFPQKLLWPSSLSSGQGTCSVPDYADAVSARLTTGQLTFERPFSFSGGSSNSPSWVTENCTAGRHPPSNACLFKADAFYGYRPNPATPGIIPDFKDWTDFAATERTAAQACSCTGDSVLGGSCLNGSATDSSTDLGACVQCLNNSGYYLFKDKNGGQRAAFSGAFLNVFPPKFIYARKVLKDLLSIDPANTSAADNVRFGITTFTSTGPLKPILPTCDNAIADNATTRHNSFVSARSTLITAIDGITFGSVTPLAQTLFKVGQYFSDGFDSAGSNDASGNAPLWKTWFPNSWDSNFWNGAQSSQSVCWSCQTSSVLIVTDGEPASDNAIPDSGYSGANHKDPFESGSNGPIDFRKWAGGTVGVTKQPIDCVDATGAWQCGTDLNNGSKNLLHLVAAFLRNWDLRKDPISETDPNPSHMAKPQNVTTYTVSIALNQASAGAQLLAKTAALGGGSYVNAVDADQLANAVFNAVTDVATKAFSFSVSNTNALQTSTAAQLFTARFLPIDRLSWEGHLYRFTLFNELALGCDATKPHNLQTPIPSTAAVCAGKNPNLDTKEVNGHAACTGFYIVDADCDAVVDDASNATFTKGSFDLNGNLTSTGRAAKPIWDAGRALSDSSYRPPLSPSATPYRSADENATSSSSRTIYTLLDNDSSSGDGQFTAADHLVEFTEANVDQIWPYLELDSTWCGQLYDRIGRTKPSSWSTNDLKTCAKDVIEFIRGWDVLDEDNDGCSAPNQTQAPKSCTENSECSPGSCDSGKCVCAAGSKGEERDQPNGLWKLSDIFHSSPQAVDPPYNEPLCDIGRGQTQCVATIHSPVALTREVQTAIDMDSNNVDAYDQWRAGAVSTTNPITQVRDRKRIVLAGANDGMLHAFDAGSPITSKPRDVFGSYPYDFGTGEELWAFIPPDLLPKLKYALDGHQYYVDGNIMVRDVWVDGSGSTTTKDRKKQKDEFHTLAIFSERSGGTQWTALDVTDPLNPKFRWSWPPLCSKEQNLVGQSWSDFAPRPPPIGPVKLLLPGNTASNPTAVKDSLGRNFEERWVAMINGGYDPIAQKGRGVWMLDAWTGGTVWQFTDQDFQSMFSSGTNGGMFPVAASPGMEDIGNADQATLDSDGYFDTATWGDMGGQLWVARFKEPGDISTGKVANWFASRAMEELRQTDDSQPWSVTLDDGTVQNRSEFYRMTANVWDPTTASLRTFLGSGNREKLLAVNPVCGPTNLIGCFQAGCNVIKFKTTTDIGSCEIQSFLQDNGGKKMQHNQVTYSSACNTAPLDCSSGVKVKVDFNLQKCGTTTTSSTFQGTLVDCDSNGVCTSRVKLSKVNNVSSKNWVFSSHNRFYGLWAYDSVRSFKDQAGAIAFDGKRFTDTPYTAAVCDGPTGNACQLVNVTYADVNASGVVSCSSGSVCSATAADPGWYYEYGRKCPLGSCDPAPPWTDEKTGSGATVLGRCVDWNSIRPMGAAVTGVPCSGGGGLPQNYTYLADIITGAPTDASCGFQASTTSAIVRASSRQSIAPPLDPTTIVTVTETGIVRQSTLQIEPGSLSSKNVYQRNELSQPVYWLEVPRDLHACRHVDTSVCR